MTTTMISPIPNLETLSMCAVVKQIWISSKLPNILPDNTNRNFQRGDMGTYIDSLKLQHEHTKLALQQKILEIKLPQIWLDKIWIGAIELDTEINLFAEDLTCNLQQGTKDNIELCCRSIFLDQLCYVDMPKTVQKILYDGIFKITFAPEFLAHHGVTFNSIENVVKRLVENYGDLRPCDYKMIYKVNSKYKDIDVYWSESFVNRFRNKHFVQRLVNYELAVFDLILISKPSPNFPVIKMFNKASAVGKYIDLIIQLNDVSLSEVLVYLLHLEVEVDLNMIAQYFSNFFNILVNSWRYRDTVVTYYANIQSFITIDTFIEILEYLRMWKSNSSSLYRFDYVFNYIFIKMWFLTSMNIKRNSDVIQRLVSLVLNDLDWNMLCRILQECSKDLRILYLEEVMKELQHPSSNNKAQLNNCMDLIVKKGLLYAEECQIYIKECEINLGKLYKLVLNNLILFK